MGSRFSLHGDMIPRSVRRLLDQRLEERLTPSQEHAVLDYRLRQHSVSVVNVSAGGAMVAFDEVPNIGEPVTLHLSGYAPAKAFVRWVKAGRVGLNFRQPPRPVQ